MTVDSPRCVAVFGIAGQSFLPQISDKLPDWEVVGWTNDQHQEDRDAIIQRCEVAVISADFILTEGNFGALLTAPNLKLMLQPWVGTDWVDANALPKGLIFCNATGHAAPMAEFVFNAMLEHKIGLSKLDKAIREGDWFRSGRNRDPNSVRGDLIGSHVGILGYGEIAQAVAHRAVAFGMSVSAVARSEREQTPAPLSWIGTRKDLERLCQDSDFLVITCDLNEETENMINAELFDIMRPHCFLVNVARGEVIEEQALFNALKENKIAGASIDTWYRYPKDIQNPEPDPDRGGPFCGSEYDFYSLNNVLLSPHSAAHTRGADRGRYNCITQSIAEYAADQPIQRHVLTGMGSSSGPVTRIT